MNLEFNVYDNIETYKRINKVDDDSRDKLIVRDMWIKPPRKAFWFQTNMKEEERHIDIHAPYVHLHEGVALPEDHIKYSKKNEVPILVQKGWMWFDPKKQQLQVRASILPWQRPLWKKSVAHYYSGGIVPEKRIPTMETFFNHNNETMSFILGFYPSRKIDDDEKLKVKAS